MIPAARSAVDDAYTRGVAAREAGRYADAEAHLRTAPEDARALNELGIVCKYTGRFDEGRVLYERALALVPPDSVEAAAILHNLGGIEHARGRNAEAEGPARRAVEVRSRALGPDALEVARGDLEEAERLHRRALANLATTLRAAGRPDEAVALDRRAHALLDGRVAPDHPTLALVRSRL